jgi:DNA invertase Pin-like site-specific DNA recombinase
MRVAIYARFSSDLQDVRSITDQVAAARDHAIRQGWRVVAEFSDAAISGASLHNRPGLLDLLVAAQAQQFDAVLTESIDRLSRDLEDIAGLHKRLRAASATATTSSPPARIAGSGPSTTPRPRSSGGSSGSMSTAARPWRLRGG